MTGKLKENKFQVFFTNIVTTNNEYFLFLLLDSMTVQTQVLENEKP